VESRTGLRNGWVTVRDTAISFTLQGCRYPLLLILSAKIPAAFQEPRTSSVEQDPQFHDNISRSVAFTYYLSLLLRVSTALSLSEFLMGDCS
jgi:hypothetical protein